MSKVDITGLRDLFIFKFGNSCGDEISKSSLLTRTTNSSVTVVVIIEFPLLPILELSVFFRILIFKSQFDSSNFKIYEDKIIQVKFLTSTFLVIYLKIYFKKSEKK